MSKRNVTYIKPNEPAFLKRIKEQVGYKEGPTVDTKRENLGPVLEEDIENTHDEQPTVVVLESTDLSAEEAAQINKQRKKEEESPADLTKPIVFTAKSKIGKEGKNLQSKGYKRTSTSKNESKFKKLKNTSLLSFDQNEEEEQVEGS